MTDAQPDREEAITGLRAVLDACAGLPLEHQLTVPLVAWLTIADSARDGAISSPGGYEAERTRQLGYLDKVVQLVKSARPDIERQRLRRVEGWTSALKRIRGSIGSVPSGRDAAPPDGG